MDVNPLERNDGKRSFNQEKGTGMCHPIVYPDSGQERFDKKASCLEVKSRNGNSLTARCPVPGHKDDNPSLSLKLNEQTGKVSVKCFGGCNYRDVLNASGVPLQYLYPPEARKNGSKPADVIYPYRTQIPSSIT